MRQGSVREAQRRGQVYEYEAGELVRVWWVWR